MKQKSQYLKNTVKGGSQAVHKGLDRTKMGLCPVPPLLLAPDAGLFRPGIVCSGPALLLASEGKVQVAPIVVGMVLIIVIIIIQVAKVLQEDQHHLAAHILHDGSDVGNQVPWILPPHHLHAHDKGIHVGPSSATGTQIAKHHGKLEGLLRVRSVKRLKGFLDILWICVGENVQDKAVEGILHLVCQGTLFVQRHIIKYATVFG